jgi:hypothetical protein
MNFSKSSCRFYACQCLTFEPVCASKCVLQRRLIKQGGIERIALRKIAGLVAFPEPVHALCRGAVCKRFGYHMTLSLPLQAVVANRIRRIQGFFYITGSIMLRPSAVRICCA